MATELHEDFTIPFASFTPVPNSINLLMITDTVSKFVDELRLASPDKLRFQWMIGAFYTRESADEGNNWPSYTPAYAPLPANNLLIELTHSTYQEKAVFGNVTYSVTDRLQIGGGERYSYYEQLVCPGTLQGLFGGDASLPCTSLPSTGVSTWMGDASFHLTPEAMVYARAATGYRPGSGCPSCGIPAEGIPGIVNPDTTTNYELGFKAGFLEHRVQIDASFFLVNWYGIQQQAISPEQAPYETNAGDAKSYGVELSGVYQVNNELRVGATLAETRAYMTSVLPSAVQSTGAVAGDQLPGSAPWMASLTADYTKRLSEDRYLLIGGSYRYRDWVLGQFPGAGNGPVNFPSAPIRDENIIDLYTGISTTRLTARLYGKNVFNNRSYTGIMYINDPTAPKYVIVQPCTVGLSVDYKY